MAAAQSRSRTVLRGAQEESAPGVDRVPTVRHRLGTGGARGVFLRQTRRASARGSSSPSIVSTAWCASVTGTIASAGASLPEGLPSAAPCDLSAISTASRPSRTGPLCSQVPSADLSVGTCPGSQEHYKKTQRGCDERSKWGLCLTTAWPAKSQEGLQFFSAASCISV